jgi:hypothetical protein
MRGGEGTFSRLYGFRPCPAFILTFSMVTRSSKTWRGIDFADRDTVLAEAVAGARDLIAHGIMQNEDVSGQVFRIRDGNGETVARVPFRDTLPGRLRG